jgi:alkyl hydroperoxide reductase subunit AhpF
MALLADDDAQYLRDSFADLAADVTVTVVTRERSPLILPGGDTSAGSDDTSHEVKQIIGEVAATSARIKVVEVDAAADRERAVALVGERQPALTFSSATSKGKLRYFGLPAGYEMSTLVAAILDLGSGEVMVPPELDAHLATLTRDVHIQVFVTPS